MILVSFGVRWAFSVSEGLDGANWGQNTEDFGKRQGIICAECLFCAMRGSNNENAEIYSDGKRGRMWRWVLLHSAILLPLPCCWRTTIRQQHGVATPKSDL